jgi:prepilin-type N-terminal cleavage/methylation domain-containing protein
MNKPMQAFTLVEMAIVLVIVGLLMGGMLAPLSAQMEQRRVADTVKALEEARDALAGFAARNGYLPCPAISASNGLEDRIGTRCGNGRRLGFLPWATLGLPKLDAWQHLYLYSVTPAFSDSGVPFRLNTPRDITIASRDAIGTLVPASAQNDIPAVVLSQGRNGFGAFSDVGVQAADMGQGNVDEKANFQSEGRIFIARGQADNPAAAGGAYDDIVVWLSPNILYNRMLAAQRLP